MNSMKKKILIVDEAIFSRICAALLEKEGYCTDVVPDVRKIEDELGKEDLGLVITSYPYGAHIFEKLQKTRVPTIILSDHVCKDLMLALDDFDKSLSHCLIKPLDYHHFRALVNQAMGGLAGSDFR